MAVTTPAGSSAAMTADTQAPEASDVARGRQSTRSGAKAEVEQAKGMIALIFAITPVEAMGLLSLAVDQRRWSLGKVARTVLELSRQPKGGDLGMVRHRFTLFLFSNMDVDALISRAESRPAPVRATLGS